MKKISIILITLLISSMFFTIVAADNNTASADLTAKAKTLITFLQNNDYKSFTSEYDDTMKLQYPEEKLKLDWEAITSQCGALKEQLETASKKVEDNFVVYTKCSFEKIELNIIISFNDKNQVAGFFIRPLEMSTPTAKPEALPQNITEKEITVVSGKWSLPGTLTTPKGKGPFPAVVLVHGSGPNDRDETIGPNKPLRDIAWGLAQNGIAVLRYEKRTRQYGKQMVGDMNFTVKEEAIDDALSAAALLRKTGNIDKNRIFVLGHSLGGFLIPRIGAQDKNIKGLISLAGPSRPLEDIILEQYEYLLSLDSSTNADVKADILNQTKAQVKTVKDTKLLSASKSLVLDLPPKYWLDLKSYDPVKTAAALKQPLLILQGERDYQVTLDNFEKWKKGLSSKKNASFKSYPGLNHLFLSGKGKSRPEEYNNPGHVDKNVISDISNFIKTTR